MSERPDRPEDVGAIVAPEDDPHIMPTLVVGVIGVVVTLVIIFGLEALHYRTEEEHVERTFSTAPSPSRERLAADQREKLGGYRWVDREKGVVSIPIERAMELVVTESGAATERDGANR